MTLPAIRPGTRHDPFGESLRGRLAGGVRQWDTYVYVHVVFVFMLFTFVLEAETRSP